VALFHEGRKVAAKWARCHFDCTLLFGFGKAGDPETLQNSCLSLQGMTRLMVAVATQPQVMEDDDSNGERNQDQRYKEMWGLGAHCHPLVTVAEQYDRLKKRRPKGRSRRQRPAPPMEMIVTTTTSIASRATRYTRNLCCCAWRRGSTSSSFSTAT